jgi:hypothetical protein
LVYGAVAAPVALWDRFATNICNDLPHLLNQRNNLPTSPDLHLDYGLFLISGMLAHHSHALADYGLPSYQYPWGHTETNQLYATELRYEPTEELRLRDEIYGQLNPDQRSCFDTIVAAVDADP